MRGHFWSKVHIAHVDDCWPWLGGRERAGYGRAIKNGQRVKAHRLAYALAHGGVPDGLFVLHRCDHKWCVNPAHLYAGTMSDNARDRWARHPERTAHRRRVATLRDQSPPRGERNPRATLRAAQVERMRRLYAAGAHSQDALAAMFRVSQSQVSRIVRHEHWT